MTLPRLVMPSVVQFSKGEIVISGGMKKDIYVLNVHKRELTKSQTKADKNMENDCMPTVLSKSFPRMIVTVDPSKKKIVEFSP